MRQEIHRVLVTTLLPSETRLSKVQRRSARRMSITIEDVLYKRAVDMENYGDLDTLRGRVMCAGGAILQHIESRNMNGVIF